ncbi:transcription factor 15-like [Rhipicephalus sanguineus]|uniref:transcription factor 15-like n=1 Tax=Rhipicephalus sanguineus TaxID=34632 RepID=UPI0018957F03|nr:transcription factor 15-like [Rhipicephalus sanguineus]
MSPRRLLPASSFHSHGVMGDALEVITEPSAKRSGAAKVNAAMVALRRLIPTDPKDRKLSKLETLRLAAGYITHLSAVRVRSGENAQEPNTVCTPFCVFCITERRSARCTTGTQQ